MPEFHCRVASPSGEVFEKSYIADDERGLRRDLDAQDLMILNVRQSNPFVQEFLNTFRLKRGVSAREFVLFNQELSALIRAGLPIVGTLDILLERRKNETFKSALIDIRDRVKSGEALSEAFAAQGEMFPKLYAASLASGERSGELGSVLQRYISYSQKVLAIRGKVLSALIYPAVLMALAVVLIGVMVFFVIPRFNEILMDFGKQLPLITRIIVGIALFCQAHWIVIIGGTLGTIMGIAIWNRSGTGRLFVDKLKLRIPLAGGIIHNYSQNRFTRTLATLQAGGIPLVTSLELSARAVGNLVFERKLLAASERVREGESLWKSMEETELVSDITIQMIKVGESTGGLEEMLNNASDFTDNEIDTSLTRMIALVEPLMLVFMAFVVGTMLMSIYLPLIELYGNQSGF